MQQQIPQLQVAHIPGAGHSIRREQFNHYIAVGRAFLGSWAATSLASTKGCNQRTYGLGGAPIVIVHGHQRQHIAQLEQWQAVEPT